MRTARDTFRVVRSHTLRKACQAGKLCALSL
ncbi:hypothetical protein EMIT0P260_130059 [Pseudomonas sp. IT-P260]